MTTNNPAYFAPLVQLNAIITAPGLYVTRSGEIVTVESTSQAHTFGCAGHYTDGKKEAWHRSGRLFATSESQNDILLKQDDATAQAHAWE